MKHCPELKNSSELGEDVERERERAAGLCIVGIRGGLGGGGRGETMMMDRHVGAPPVSKQQECKSGLVGPGTLSQPCDLM